ncbi:MAG: hypothetical protein Q7R94_03265 [bacterium]|nr:hypothetical protein [bacterium]
MNKTAVKFCLVIAIMYAGHLALQRQRTQQPATPQAASQAAINELYLDGLGSASGSGSVSSTMHTIDVDGKTLVYFYGGDYDGIYDHTIVPGYKESEPYEAKGWGKAIQIRTISGEEQETIRKRLGSKVIGPLNFW